VHRVSRLSEISVRVEVPARVGGLGGGVQAVLSELANMLEALAGGAPSAAIDLRSLPMSPQDRIELQAALGDGEVRATLTAGGMSILRETALSGVWWIEHRDEKEELIAELIEVGTFPAILETSLDEAALSARTLRERLAARSDRSENTDHAQHN
jgi:hydrogenase-1 operon protein HyaF